MTDSGPVAAAADAYFYCRNLAGVKRMDHDYLRRNYLEVGLKFCKAGNWIRSAQILEAGLHECERIGLQDILSAAILCNLAVVNQRLGKSEVVERYLLRSLSISKRFFHDKHPSVIAISRLLANHYYELGFLQEAGQLYKRALAGASLKREERVDCLIRLAAIENAYHRRSRAEALCREVCELRYGGVRSRNS